MAGHKEIRGEGGGILLYRGKDGRSSLEVRLDQETLWLSLNQMAALFERDKSVISRHLGNVFRTNELARDGVVAYFATTAADGKTYQVEYFNLDAIISVGYRVNSQRGTQFRIWATQVLREHLLQGYTLNEQRLQSEVSRLRELQAAVDVMGRILSEKAITGTTAPSASPTTPSSR